MSTRWEEAKDRWEFEDYSTPWIVQVWRRIWNSVHALPDRIVSHVRWFWQRRRRGFDDRDIWSLDTTIARFVLPRLKLLRERAHGYPDRHEDYGFATFEQWQEAMDKMIAAMEFTASDDFYDGTSPTPYDQHREGLELFGKYMWSLWD